MLRTGKIQLARLPAVNLILFNIDGTLIQSQSIDGEIYLHSLAEVFGFTNVGSDWSAYKHTTDAGILHEIFEVYLGRAPTPAELSVFRTHFVDAIAFSAAQRPFREVDGARQVLRHLAESPLHGIGLATGGWGTSARCNNENSHRSGYGSRRPTTRHHCVCWRCRPCERMTPACLH